MQRAIKAAASLQCLTLIECAPGRYDFYMDEAIRAPCFITNTASEIENPDITKTIGLLFRGMRNITLDGKGALFVFHCKQTMFVISELKVTNSFLKKRSP
ncbi:hypothetical protein ACP8HI_08270 [Paenibacillus sp. FA6]|uniref:hypothetical protein n=1 Tax=Paenibacillus sp. FA6 TaxID=3413029 RepID=UPI003F65D43D